MLKLEEKYKETFDKVELNQNEKNKIYDSVTQNKKHNFNFKLALASCIILLLCSFGVAYAIENVDLFRNLKIKYVKSKNEDGKDYHKIYVDNDAVVEINYDADIPEKTYFFENKITYSYDELEKLLGIKFLKSKLFKNNELIQYDVKKENNKISSASFVLNDILSEESENNKIFAYMKISLKTRHNTKDYTKSGYLPYATDERNVVEELYIKKLDTMALVVKEGTRKNCYRILFLYDNINYSFLIIFPTEESNNSLKIKSILNSLEY